MREADAIVANTPRACEFLYRAYPQYASKMTSITNGYDPEAFELNPIPPLSGPTIEIIHTGTIYANRSPNPFLEAIQHLEPEALAGKTVRVRFIGGVVAGRQRNEIEAQMREVLNASCVSGRPRAAFAIDTGHGPGGFSAPARHPWAARGRPRQALRIHRSRSTDPGLGRARKRRRLGPEGKWSRPSSRTAPRSRGDPTRPDRAPARPRDRPLRRAMPAASISVHSEAPRGRAGHRAGFLREGDVLEDRRSIAGGGSPMNPIVLVRRGEGPVWGRVKRLALAILRVHVPVVPLTRPFFRMLYCLHVGVRDGGTFLLNFFWFEPLFRSQCTTVGRGRVVEFLPFIQGNGRLILGDHVRMAGKPSFAFLNRWIDAPELVIGDHTFVGHACSIAVAESVRIGKHCRLAANVAVSDYDGHPTDALVRGTSPAPRESIEPVVIGDDVWIGAGARILKGVSIGDRAIVGSGAVVTKSVPPDVVVVGNPARVVKHLAAPPVGPEESCVAQSKDCDE